jgi:primosomal protein N' (replication factor Y)
VAGHDEAPGRRASLGRRRGASEPVLSRIVRVVPDVPSFNVDDGFAYAVPDGIEAPIGSIVRVPLGGRRVRGWVVAESDGDASGLKPLAGRSGDLEVFDRRRLDVMRWAAARYVAPLASILGKATPPNLPRAKQWRDRPPLDAGPAPDLAARLLDGARPPTAVWWGPGPWAPPIAATVAPLLSAGRGVLVVAATVQEGEALARQLGDVLGDRVVFASSAGTGAEQTKAWVEAAARPGTLLVGTRQIALWPVADLALAVVVGEGRRGMKDKSTPTTHARELLLRRSAVERFGLVLADLIPSAEAVSRGAAEQVPATGRAWGHVEIVDRRADRGGTLIGDTARSALRAAMAAGTQVLVFTHRRAVSQRCVRCRTMRRCSVCGSGSFETAECVRCGARADACGECGFSRFEMLGAGVGRVRAEVGRVVGREHVGEPGSGAPVVVGTERDLPGLDVGLTIVVDGDGPLLAPTYRAGEEALRLFARAIGVAGRGRGRRGLVQTSDPTHPVFDALRGAVPIPFLVSDAAARAAAGFPPGGELLVVEADAPPEDATDDLVAAVGGRAEVLGPADAGGRTRWLVQGPDITPARVAIRALVARWRDGGARVRVDADPVDL